MRVVALEEHFTVPAVVSKYVNPDAIAARGHYKGRKVAPGKASPMELLPEIGEKRFKSMDDAGITVQVLSNSGPGPDLVPGADGVAMAREINDYLAGVVTKHPKRFAGFAALPMASPDACADELRRAVKDLKFVGAMIHGTTRTASSIIRATTACSRRPSSSTCRSTSTRTCRCPTIQQVYYSGLPEGADRVLGTAGWGWHSEVAIHILRMVLAGTFDKHPKLKMIIGHMGEMLPVMLARLDEVGAADVGHLKRLPSQTIVDQVWITTSGIFSQPPFIAALQTFGIDRIMFSVDYPFAPDAEGREFLNEVALAPADMAKLCHGNADALLKLKA